VGRWHGPPSSCQPLDVVVAAGALPAEAPDDVPLPAALPPDGPVVPLLEVPMPDEAELPGAVVVVSGGEVPEDALLEPPEDAGRVVLGTVVAGTVVAGTDVAGTGVAGPGVVTTGRGRNKK
jgi:hypothetical protein